MMTFSRFRAPLIVIGLASAYASAGQAQSMYQNYGDPYFAAPQIPEKPMSYGERTGEKLVNGFANLTTASLEIPKNVINTTNQSNIFYGLIGGSAKGIVNMAGRMGVGIADLITFPIPTKPIAYPLYIWDDFDVDTSYGGVMRLQEQQRITSVDAPQPAPPATAPAGPPPVQYPSDTNRKLDANFKQEMIK